LDIIYRSYKEEIMGLNKEYVNYRVSTKEKKKCLTCDFFYGPSSCEIVQGNISPEAVCDRFFIGGRGSNFAKGGDFYVKQYELKRVQEGVKK